MTMRRSVRIALATLVLASAPFLGASADPDPLTCTSASASPAPPTLTAALFAGTSSAPSEDAWRSAAPIPGVRMGEGARAQGCRAWHVAEWVRIGCGGLEAVRIDLLAGEKRDLTLLGSKDGSQGEEMTAQFSMRPGDRRILQWIAPDLWEEVWPGDNGDWMTGGAHAIGPMYGVSLQVDWASGSDPIISMF
jgi:hypothetical protein